MPIGFYDPDADPKEEARLKKKSSLPKTELAKLAFAACRRTYFKMGTDEKKRWKAIEAPTLGASQEDIMILEWIKHNIGLAREANKMQTVRSLGWLMSACENQDRRSDWIVANRDRVLKERAKAITDDFFGDS